MWPLTPSHSTAAHFSAPASHVVEQVVVTKRMESLFVNNQRNVYVGISERHSQNIRVREMHCFADRPISQLDP